MTAATIELRSDLARSVALEVLTHELLHHAWHLTALPTLLEDQEEIVVRSLAPFVTELLLQPNLLDRLVDRLGFE